MVAENINSIQDSADAAIFESGLFSQKKDILLSRILAS
jgi:hypothetical protein